MRKSEKLVTWLIKRSGSHLYFPHVLIRTCMGKGGGGDGAGACGPKPTRMPY